MIPLIVIQTVPAAGGCDCDCDSEGCCASDCC